MKHLVFVALGGAGGAVARYLLTLYVNSAMPGKFPWATLIVNLAGSFCIGIMYVLIAERAALHPDWRSVVTVGFLGAFTTYSTFSLETVTLIESGYTGLAVAYMLVSVGGCVGAAWIAIHATRLL